MSVVDLADYEGHEQQAAAAMTENGIPVRNLWYMLLYAWKLPELRDRWQSEVEQAPSLDWLLAEVLMQLVRRQLRIGLGGDYRASCDTLAGIRGRIDFAASLRKRTFQNGRAVCHFGEFSTNVARNQIIRSTMNRLAATGDFGSQKKQSDGLRGRLLRLVRELEPIELILPTVEIVSRELDRRHDGDYQLMLQICSMLLQRLMPTESEGTRWSLRIDRRKFRLFDVFEKFVAEFYGRHLSDWVVKSQTTLKWPVSDSSGYLPNLVPDIWLGHRSTGQVMVLDTKFTRHILNDGQWGKQRFDRNHLFQIYAYLRSQEEVSEQHRNATGILLYPAVGDWQPVNLRFQGHSIWWQTVNLAKGWEEIEQGLLAVIAAAEDTTQSD